MVLSPLRGALGFLTRVPVGGDAADWRAFTDAPWTFPVVAVPVGLVLAAPLLLGERIGSPLPAGVLFLGALVALLGITHLDGVADLGDAAAVHGDPEKRVSVLKDSDVGVGAVVALVLALLATASGAAFAGSLGHAATVAVVVGAEVGAKTAMAALACLGSAAHEGLGSQLTDWNRGRELGPVALVVLVVLLLVIGVAPAALPAALGALFGALVAGGLLARWANGLLDGVNGDVFGAVDVAARVAGLYAGVAVLRWADALFALAGVGT